MSQEMAPFFVGPMPPQEFLSTFLSGSRSWASSFEAGMFDALANSQSETSMYRAFINIVQPHLKTIYIRDTSRSPDKALADHSVSFSPDCTVYDESSKNFTDNDSASSDFCIEFKFRAEEDAFSTDFTDEGPAVSSPTRIMSQKPKGITTAGQITTYTALQLDCQYRTHVFSVLVVKDYARLIRWDRSGAIVTAPIYYQHDPVLLDFFTLYDQAERPVRGHDISVRVARQAETLKAACASNEFLISQELLVVTVPLQGRESEWGEDHIVFFKDSWRVACDGIKREGELYAILNRACIPNVPRCLASGDVGEDIYHSTCTSQFANAPWALTSSKHEFTPHRHHRLILDNIGKKLETFQCSKDMVRAVLAALIAHRDAYNKCRILHRDISPNNILLTECSNFEGGMLIDWDLCKMVDPDDPSAGGARQSTCTGTWQFMAADLIGNPKINQTFIHDIESAFFVLLWMATHYVQAELQTDHLSGLVNSVFHPQIFGSSGGPGKIMFMRGEEELDGLVFRDNAPLTQLLCTLKELLAVHHRKRPEAPHPHRLNINDVIHQALHEGAQGITLSLELSAADELSQDEKGVPSVTPRVQ
ncbi:hypothetical protein H4582DRAFT_2087211 [Lactarius indigo]|nr:hypothetical protein H4582DRAFT_2087211 [Lactarius indigo]